MHGELIGLPNAKSVFLRGKKIVGDIFNYFISYFCWHALSVSQINLIKHGARTTLIQKLKYITR